LHEAFHGQLEKAEDPFTVLADYFGRGVFNTLPSWETTVSDSVVRKTLSTVPMWGPVNAGPGSEAQIRRTEGKSSISSTGDYQFYYYFKLNWILRKSIAKEKENRSLYKYKIIIQNPCCVSRICQ
jgi:Vacuolar protein sorting protein 11 C terminal